jgi:hypothetical protein
MLCCNIRVAAALRCVLLEFLFVQHAHRHPASPPFSLLRLSAAQRLAGVGAILIALWAMVAWALA